MGSWPLITRVDRIIDVGSVTASTTWTTVTASATVNTKGSYAQLIASTAFDADAFYVGIKTSTASINFLVDLSVGAAASEQIILPNIMFRSAAAIASPFTLLYVPVHVKKGQRIAARSQSSTASAACVVGVYLFGAT
jgi:hypothetical protein